jgi:membrane-associated phospholipid phosphatase
MRIKNIFSRFSFKPTKIKLLESTSVYRFASGPADTFANLITCATLFFLFNHHTMLKKTFLLVFISISSQLSFSQNWDINTLRSINVYRNTSLDGTYKTISNTTIPIAAGVPVLLYGIAYLQHDGTAKRKAIYMGESVAVSAVISEITKRIVKRDRPFVTYPYIQNLQAESGYSFPSGHASVAFALATSVSLAYPKWYIIAPSFLWAGEVGYSRLHLGVHYPTDVIAGAVVGAGSTYIAYKLDKWLFQPKKKRLLRN